MAAKPDIRAFFDEATDTVSCLGPPLHRYVAGQQGDWR
jgi:hypothetical protein